MGEILGLGVSHYPPLSGLDDDMSGILKWTLEDPAIPSDQKDVSRWPPEMKREWGTDQGTAAAVHHRAALVAEFERARQVLDRFDPDVVVIWGDDQYENFKEDIIPPYAILLYGDLDVQPWAHAQGSSVMVGKPNIWGEKAETTFTIKGHPDLGKYLVSELLAQGIDIPYAYKPLHHKSLPHAFINTILYLDYHRKGFPYPVLAFPLNCYGRRVVSCRGFLTRFGAVAEFDPPSPTPRRLMEVGGATARALRKSRWRVALIASSSWSHAFLCDKTWRLRPDTEGDRRLYWSLEAGDYGVWRQMTLDQIEDAGQQEMLNWFTLAGAMEELGRTPTWTAFVGTSIFNSNKVFAIFEP